jgi:ATP-dependent Clp protease ATP-binding subunit ClpA
MYERFTDRARKVMQLAHQEALRVNHEYIGTEHILLGLVAEGSGVAANVLKNLDIDLRKVRKGVEQIIQTGPALDPKIRQTLPQTPRTKKAIEFAVEEARNLNHNYVGTEHLLLGLLREQDGVAAQVLISLGVTLDGVREETLKLLGHNIPDSPAAPRPAPPADLSFLPPEVRDFVDGLVAEIDRLTAAKEDAVASYDFERAARLREQAVNLGRAKNAVVREWAVKKPGEPPVN